MAPHSRFPVIIAVAAMVLLAPLYAHHYLKHDFYVYDVVTNGYIIGAEVTVSYPNGSQTGYTGRPHGNVQFRLPGELESAQAVVIAEGYCDFDESIPLGRRPHVGGRGIWIALMECGPRP
jgi:hypothetical protein